MIVKRTLLLVLASLLLTYLHTAASENEGDDDDDDGPPPKHYNIILVGATGDLAEKYLWRGFFNLFSRNFMPGKVQFTFYGCSRKDPDQGRTAMSSILLNVIKCGDDECRENKKKFVESVQYHQLKKESHYKSLSDKVAENTQSMYALLDTKFSYEEGRLVYLSIPPSQYAKTAKLVNKYLRPRLGRNPWMRLVIEKPFGHDLNSATQLARDIREFFSEQETYRADHYLGKTVVKQILPFRYVNAKTYGKLWNRHHIERVEVVMKEKIDVKDRTSFYDEVEIIRDVMQNHLMEMMALVTMETPEQSGNIDALLESKLKVFKQFDLKQDGCLMGQYSTYNSEWLAESQQANNVSQTPTFASCLLHVNNGRWRDVPFILMSGKKMDEKMSYVRIVFKNNKFCTSKEDISCSRKSQLVFFIGSSYLHVPGMVVVSDNLPRPKASSGWKNGNLKLDFSLFGESINNTYQIVPEYEDDAYTNVIKAVFDGNRQMFINEASLLQSWRLWTSVLQDLEGQMPRIYQGKDVDSDSLAFHIENNVIRFDTEQDVFNFESVGLPSFSGRQIPPLFLGKKLVAAPKGELIDKLANEILDVGRLAVADRGIFHLAVPGGLSPLPLFLKLASPEFSSFPWDLTHIWHVDERCVDLSDQDSNFFSVYNNLVRHVPILYWNIHPMPVSLGSGVCDDADGGLSLYAGSLKRLAVNMSIDFTLLGLGADGHIASLFPNQPFLESNGNPILFSSAPPGKPSPKRMTMSLDLLNKSHNIGILVNSMWKKDIVSALSSQSESELAQYPVYHVKSVSGSTTFFIDFAALFGDL